jgi:hypothetical protein
VNELFQNLYAFIESAEKKAKDAASKAAAVVRSWADWLESLAAGPAMMAAGPEEDADLAACQERLVALQAVGADPAPDPKKIDPASLALIITAVIELIKFLRERRKPTT